MKKYIKTALIIAIILVSQSCEKVNTLDTYKNEDFDLLIKNKKLSVDLSGKIEFIVINKSKFVDKIRFSSYLRNNNLKTYLYFKKHNEKKWIKINSFDINLKDNKYLNEMNIKVENKANLLLNSFEYNIIIEIENILKKIPKVLFEKLNREEYYNETNLAIFWHLATFNSAGRAYEYNNKTCNCGLYEESLNEKTPFFCSEDKLIDRDEAYQLISDITEKTFGYGKKFTPVKTFSFLKSSDKYLQASEIDFILNSEFKLFWEKTLDEKDRKLILENYNDANIHNKILQLPCIMIGVSSGSDCGCCGNYSGSCLFCAMTCLYHDLSCTDCDWWCFSGCVSGSCY